MPDHDGSAPMAERTVRMPRCGPCAAGKCVRCEHPQHIEGVGLGSVSTCCCVIVREQDGIHAG